MRKIFYSYLGENHLKVTSAIAHQGAIHGSGVIDATQEDLERYIDNNEFVLFQQPNKVESHEKNAKAFKILFHFPLIEKIRAMQLRVLETYFSNLDYIKEHMTFTAIQDHFQESSFSTLDPAVILAFTPVSSGELVVFRSTAKKNQFFEIEMFLDQYELSIFRNAQL
jgi:hypothetical protein